MNIIIKNGLPYRFLKETDEAVLFINDNQDIITIMKELIRPNEVRLYPNNLRRKDSYFNVHARNDWFSKEFVYKVYDDRVVFRRPTLDYKNFPTRARKVIESWVFYLSLPDQESRRLEIHDEDITEDEAILYR